MTFLTLQGPIRWLFLAHALVGTMALAVLVIPIATKKGGRIHRRAGWIYTSAMVLVGLTAMVITPWRALADPHRTPRSQAFAVFLCLIAVFTLSALSYGISALRHKQRRVPSRSMLLIGPPIAVIVLGVVTVIVGMHLRSVLLVTFPAFAFFGAAGQLSYWLRAPTRRMHWWYAHMVGMFTACIATITAFLVTALPRIWPNPFTRSPVPWIAPGLILGLVLSRWIAKYQARFKDAARLEPGASATSY